MMLAYSLFPFVSHYFFHSEVKLVKPVSSNEQSFLISRDDNSGIFVVSFFHFHIHCCEPHYVEWLIVVIHVLYLLRHRSCKPYVYLQQLSQVWLRFSCSRRTRFDNRLEALCVYFLFNRNSWLPPHPTCSTMLSSSCSVHFLIGFVLFNQFDSPLSSCSIESASSSHIASFWSLAHSC